MFPKNACAPSITFAAPFCASDAIAAAAGPTAARADAPAHSEMRKTPHTSMHIATRARGLIRKCISPGYENAYRNSRARPHSEITKTAYENAYSHARVCGRADVREEERQVLEEVARDVEAALAPVREQGPTTAHACAHTHAHTYTYIHTRTHTHKHTHTHTNTHTQTHTNTHAHTQTRTHTHTQCIHACTSRSRS